MPNECLKDTALSWAIGVEASAARRRSWRIAWGWHPFSGPKVSTVREHFCSTIRSMTETAESSVEPTTVTRQGHVDNRDDRPSPLSHHVLAWVGITAGVLFIVVVIFFSGFYLGRSLGGHRGYDGDRDGSSSGQMGPGGMMGPGYTGPGGMMGPNHTGPGGMMGPGYTGRGGMMGPNQSPTTEAPSTPRP